ncbi:MAG: LysR family transcriptional regulator [Rubrivivax sp.]|jgi:DNA-binding transcriptional LysR family regulator
MAFPGGLRVFYEAVQAGSIRAAGDKLNLAASSVSRQIQLLEHQLGAQLLDRSAAGVQATDAGRRVAEFAKTVLLDYDSLCADISERRGARTGFIRIAAVESTVAEPVVSTLTRFRQQAPGVAFQLRMLPAPEVVEAVKRGEADLGVTFCAPPDTQLSVLARFPEPVVLAVAPSHPWALRARGAPAAPVALQALPGVALALPEASFGVRRLLDAALQAADVSLRPALVSDSFEALRAFARQGAGAAVLPRQAMAAEQRAGLLTELRLATPALNSSTADVVVLRARRPARLLKRFVDELQRAASLAA